MNQFSRTELLIGKEGIEKLKEAKVAIFGLGGVGSYVAEGLVRAGVGNFVLIDNDEVSITNINRQIIATTKTVGMSKVEVAKKRIQEINPKAIVQIYKTFYMPGMGGIIKEDINYIVDAIDTVTAKIGLIEEAKNMNIPIISCMGTGNKLNPCMLEVADIYKTEVCPLAKTMRKELRKRDIKKLKVVYSKEEPVEQYETGEIEYKGKTKVPGSISFVPSVAGMIIASEVVKDLIK